VPAHPAKLPLRRPAHTCTFGPDDVKFALYLTRLARYLVARSGSDDQSQAGGFDDFGSADAVVFHHANMI